MPATDWRTVGYQDGVNGFAGDRIGRYRNACSEHGVTPDLTQYQAGRDQGLHSVFANRRTASGSARAAVITAASVPPTSTSRSSTLINPDASSMFYARGSDRLRTDLFPMRAELTRSTETW